EGAFELSRIPEGEYQVRAFEDVNRNRALEVYEARDSAEATVVDGQPIELALRILPPDSTAPAISAVTAAGRIVEIEFDDYLDPEQTVSVDQVTIAHPTEGAVAIGRVGLGRLSPPDTVAAPVAVDSAAAGPAASPPPPDGRPTQLL